MLMHNIYKYIMQTNFPIAPTTYIFRKQNQGKCIPFVIPPPCVLFSYGIFMLPTDISLKMRR